MMRDFARALVIVLAVLFLGAVVREADDGRNIEMEMMK
jgi:hypothetical protein